MRTPIVSSVKTWRNSSIIACCYHIFGTLSVSALKCAPSRLSGQKVCEPLDKTNLFYELFYPKNACEERDCCWNSETAVCYKPILPEIKLKHVPEWSEWSNWEAKTGEDCKLYRARKCDGIFTGQLASYFCKNGDFEETKLNKLCKKSSCLPNTCGTNSYNFDEVSRVKKVVGGSRADEKSFPWMVALYKFEDNDREFFCGATLICDKFVITAGHCTEHRSSYRRQPDLDPEMYQLRFGLHNNPLTHFNAENTETRKGRTGLKAIHPHPLFQPKNPDGYVATGNEQSSLQLHDLALIELRIPLDFTDYIKPICLPDVVPEAQDVIWGAGWGLTKGVGDDNLKLKQVAQRIVEDTTCKRRLDRFGRVARKTGTNIWYDGEVGLFCAGGEYQQDTCLGDSGGPGITQSPITNKFILSGVISTGTETCNSNYYDVMPALFMNVSHYMPWILETTSHCC